MKLNRNSLVLTAICSLGLASVSHAAMVLSFNGDGGGTAASVVRTQSGTITIDLGDASTSMVNTGGLNAPSASGSLAGLTGTLGISFIALGTSADNFDPVDFTGGTTYGVDKFTSVYTTSSTWAGGSDINENVNNFPGQAIVFTLDLSNVVGDTSNLALTAVAMQNDTDGGARINHLANGAPSSTAVYAGGGTLGNNVEYDVSQVLADGDALAFWTAPSSGQRRLRSFTFDVIPEPSVALLGGLGLLGLLRRRRA
ncbi:hypothetical protein [Haloferula sp.]|uniref:hypothetical protein n=1 Tax=Haloferula sp. TaxID=2497595 RepID=UPI003C71812C